MTKIDRILDKVEETHRSVEWLVKRFSNEGIPDEESYQTAIRQLADHHLVHEWLQDAGLSSYEISVAQENTVAGAVMLNAIIEGIKTGLMLSVRVIREESEIAVEAVQGWLAAEELVKSAGKTAKKEKPVAQRIESMFTERAKMMMARAEALEASDDPELNAESIAEQAAFLRGRAREAQEFATLIVTTLGMAPLDKQ
jgi:hypothetical protein